ncbi:MAG: lipid IV(A) 3-deoxy-D-manno-octulosonic acid transferase [Pseudomonadales bacterium]|nr:lipid IV(A) 3-deoxy-D-manno-octulosonic acid transferase [Pseudomonadales bacterium]
MWRFFYSILFYLALPAILMRLLMRSIQVPAYRQRIAERFAVGHTRLKSCIWVHAVSVGETLAAVPVIERLLERYPDEDILVTTMTPTGSERVKAVFGERVYHVYAPYDLPGAVKRFVRRYNPRLLIVMETELWPNIIHYSHQAGCPSIIANARLSARSAAGYKKLSRLTQLMLAEISLLAAQAKPDAQRFLSLGLKPSQLTVTGSIKFDLAIDENLKIASLKTREQWGKGRLVFIAASTHVGEDEQILAVFDKLKASFPSLLLVIVPRHPERFDTVAQMIETHGFNMARRSLHDAEDNEKLMAGVDVLLGDTMGELLLLYGASDVAFVGGSLVSTGGHNVLEPLAYGVPAIVGPHMFNFQVISDLLLEAVPSFKWRMRNNCWFKRRLC